MTSAQQFFKAPASREQGVRIGDAEGKVKDYVTLLQVSVQLQMQLPDAHIIWKNFYKLTQPLREFWSHLKRKFDNKFDEHDLKIISAQDHPKVLTVIDLLVKEIRHLCDSDSSLPKKSKQKHDGKDKENDPSVSFNQFGPGQKQPQQNLLKKLSEKPETYWQEKLSDGFPRFYCPSFCATGKCSYLTGRLGRCFYGEHGGHPTVVSPELKAACEAREQARLKAKEKGGKGKGKAKAAGKGRPGLRSMMLTEVDSEVDSDDEQDDPADKQLKLELAQGLVEGLAPAPATGLGPL